MRRIPAGQPRAWDSLARGSQLSGALAQTVPVFEVESPEGVSDQEIEETKTALKELGLSGELTIMPRGKT